MIRALAALSTVALREFRIVSRQFARKQGCSQAGAPPAHVTIAEFTVITVTHALQTEANEERHC